MNTIDFDQFLSQLSVVSEEQFIDPTQFDWPEELDPDAWYFTPELISIYGSPVWESLEESQRKRLSFTEAVNFFSLNIHGEKYLISEISRRLYNGDNNNIVRTDDVATTGHVISADNIINLAALQASGELKSGEKILTFMAGYGSNWQCALLEAV